MDTKPHQQKGRDNALSLLNLAIEALDLEYHTSKGRLWLRQRPHDDQGTCYPLQP